MVMARAAGTDVICLAAGTCHEGHDAHGMHGVILARSKSGPGGANITYMLVRCNRSGQGRAGGACKVQQLRAPERESEERARIVLVQAAAKVRQEGRKGVGELRQQVGTLEGDLQACGRAAGDWGHAS